jgi:ribosome-binding protein aMBF1 (putative translation factor)
MEHNTKVTVLRNPTIQKKQTKIHNNNVKNNNEEIPKLNLVGKDIGLKISQARTLKNLKQKEVAKYMNMDISIYQKYENGTAIRNGNILNKLGNYLGVKLNGKKLNK